MVGLPDSGKTTRAKKLERSVPAVRLTPDESHLRSRSGRSRARHKAPCHRRTVLGDSRAHTRTGRRYCIALWFLVSD
ncbi:TPA: hypothetical protein ACIYLT_004896 [Escherichia coli]